MIGVLSKRAVVASIKLPVTLPVCVLYKWCSPAHSLGTGCAHVRVWWWFQAVQCDIQRTPCDNVTVENSKITKLSPVVLFEGGAYSKGVFEGGACYLPRGGNAGDNVARKMVAPHHTFDRLLGLGLSYTDSTHLTGCYKH